MHDLGGHPWWRQSEAARALGLVRAEGALRPLLACLDDSHEEVRAAAVEALGHLGDPGCVPALLRALPDASRHQRARVVEAIRALGPGVAHALVAHARVHPDDLATVAELIGFTGAASASDDLLAWSSHPDDKVRASALQALGSLGLDDRAYYYTLRALGDTSEAVRAMAARALGRSRRGDAAPYLAHHLADEWLVAAHAATALRMLGPAGERELVARQEAPGLAGVLARQMLWERRSRPEAGGGA
jgi:HEAT repeat protein